MAQCLEVGCLGRSSGLPLKNRLTLRPSKAIHLNVNYSLNLRLSLNALLLSCAVVGVW